MLYKWEVKNSKTQLVIIFILGNLNFGKDKAVDFVDKFFVRL